MIHLRYKISIWILCWIPSRVLFRLSERILLQSTQRIHFRNIRKISPMKYREESSFRVSSRILLRSTRGSQTWLLGDLQLLSKLVHNKKHVRRRDPHRGQAKGNNLFGTSQLALPKEHTCAGLCSDYTVRVLIYQFLFKFIHQRAVGIFRGSWL